MGDHGARSRGDSIRICPCRSCTLGPERRAAGRFYSLIGWCWWSHKCFWSLKRSACGSLRSGNDCRKIWHTGCRVSRFDVGQLWTIWRLSPPEVDAPSLFLVEEAPPTIPVALGSYRCAIWALRRTWVLLLRSHWEDVLDLGAWWDPSVPTAISCRLERPLTVTGFHRCSMLRCQIQRGCATCSWGWKRVRFVVLRAMEFRILGFGAGAVQMEVTWRFGGYSGLY